MSEHSWEFLGMPADATCYITISVSFPFAPDTIVDYFVIVMLSCTWSCYVVLQVEPSVFPLASVTSRWKGVGLMPTASQGAEDLERLADA